MKYRWIIHYFHKNDNINSYLNPHPPFWDVRNIDASGIVVLNWVTFIIYSSFIIPLECCFSWHTFWKGCCVCLHMTSRFYEIDIGCMVVNEIYVILKLLTWPWKYNILFHKNKTISLLFKSFFVKVFPFVSMLAFHIRV